MTGRRRALTLAALSIATVALAGCSTVVDGSGGRPSPTEVAPCALRPSSVPSSVPSGGASGSSSAAAAPGCIPSPSPSPPPSTGGSTGQASSRWAQFGRSIFSTKLGDPALINVCNIAGSTALPLAFRTIRPDSTLAASCTLELSSPDVTGEPSLVVSVLRDSKSPARAGATRTTVLGQTVLADPYDAAAGTCGRTLQLQQPDVTTSVRTSTYGTIPGGRAAVCGIQDAVIRSFASVASGAKPVDVLPTASPSLLGLDACKVATAAGLATLPLLNGLGNPIPADFDTSCGYQKGTSAFFVSAGLLRSSNDDPDGSPVTVGRHRFFDTAPRDGVCQYVSKQAEGETLEAYYSPGSTTPSPDTCRQIAGTLGLYLDVLGLS